VERQSCLASLEVVQVRVLAEERILAGSSCSNQHLLHIVEEYSHFVAGMAPEKVDLSPGDDTALEDIVENTLLVDIVLEDPIVLENYILHREVADLVLGHNMADCSLSF
jgi:hypothetical protein